MAKETKAEWLQNEISEAVGAGKAYDVETVDFSDPNRPLTCLEVDFPIIPINQIASIEGNAGKPIYQMSKWWARRRSSVFRAMLLAGAMKAPDEKSDSAKNVWNVYYGNHQRKGIFKNIKVADVFMGGGTTIVEGSRLGMQMYGNDLNPVAWFIVKNEMSKINRSDVENTLCEIENKVKPEIAPFYTCECPRGHKSKWYSVETGEKMPDDFDIWTISPNERKLYRYDGAEMIYSFWAKHAKCSVTGCGHRTPIMNTPVISVKSFSAKYWVRKCQHCEMEYHLEEKEARMAPGSPLVVDNAEVPYALLITKKEHDEAICPNCGSTDKFEATWASKIKPKKKKINLTLLLHPDWIKGESSFSQSGEEYGGSVEDSTEATIRWNLQREKSCSFIEYRGKLAEKVECPVTKRIFFTDERGGNLSGRGLFACGECGTSQNRTDSIGKTKKTASLGTYAIQGYCPHCDAESKLYGGRFFIPASESKALNKAIEEWNDLKDFHFLSSYPKSEIPFGHETHQRQPFEQHGYTHWWKMFNQRQLQTLSRLLLEIQKIENKNVGEYIMGAFQQYLRNQVLFTIWNAQRDTPEPMFANNNYHPKTTSIENCVFPKIGRGNWQTQSEILPECIEWSENPWEIVSNSNIINIAPHLEGEVSGKSEKVYPNDPITPPSLLTCGSSTDLKYNDSSIDMVITDPPFGDNVQYSELSDFFYVWIRLYFKDIYPEIFSGEYTPKTLEAVSNKARQPGTSKENALSAADEYYKKVLTECWKESYRILKPGGTLAFTFHHSEDEPWIAVLESLFDAGFYLQGTFPIRSDETKGDGEFGSKKIEYDIVHVCRKHLEDTKAISWARLRRQVLHDVRRLQDLLEHHQMEGLPEADIQVIRRGKALEYFSKHYGKVFKSEGEVMTVQEALVGVNQILEEETGETKTVPPHEAESFTRMLLRLFDNKKELDRDQIQKFLRGSGASPSDFLARGWCTESKKVFALRPMPEMAKEIYDKKHIQRVTCDYEQAALLIGACFENSGINVTKILNDKNFKPHPALKSVLEWFWNHGADDNVGAAARKASDIYNGWLQKHKPEEMANLFDFFGEA